MVFPTHITPVAVTEVETRGVRRERTKCESSSTGLTMICTGLRCGCLPLGCRTGDSSNLNCISSNGVIIYIEDVV